MTHQIKKRALLIGIDSYNHHPLKQETPRLKVSGKEIVYKDLKGAVNDILAVRHFLINTMGVEDSNITMLLAPVPGKKYHLGLPERQYKEPTYENIICALVDLATEANSKDLVYVHYSGHGGHATTIFRDWKCPEDSEDHTVVPSDIKCGGKFLRDIEIGALLQDIVKKEVILTVVFDSCYSGGALRDDDDDDDEDAEEDVRSVASLYESDPKEDGLDLPIDKRSRESIERWGTVDWMRAPSGFVVLTACQYDQKAKEMQVHNDGVLRHHGVLTYWLLETIRTSPLLLSSDAVYNGVCAKVGNRYSGQTPHFLGERDRFFFDAQFRRRLYSLPVKMIRRESATKSSLVLGGGWVDCTQQNSMYSILPIHFDFNKQITPEDILARVEIKTVKAVESITKPLEKDKIPRRQEIREGCPAVLYSLPFERQSTIKFCATDDSQLDDVHKEFDQACTDGFATWLRRVDDHAVFDVRVNKDRKLEVNDQAGLLTAQMDEYLEPIKWDGGESMLRLIIRLSHLARFKLIKSLGNLGNSLANHISVDVSPSPREVCIHGELCRPVAEMKKEKDIYTVPPNACFRISVTNGTNKPVGCVVLNLTVDFAITKVYPGGEPFKNIAPGGTAAEDFIETIPENLASLAKRNTPFVETFKVIVTDPLKDLDSLVIGSLEDVEDPSRDDELELEDQLNDLNGLLEDLSSTRAGIPASSFEGDWHTVDVLVQVVS